MLVVIDFSYGMGYFVFVLDMCIVVIVVGVDGLIVEVYFDLEVVMSDGY